MKKKLLSLALALALCLGLTVPAFAADLKIVEVPVPAVEEYEGKNYGTMEFHEGLSKLFLYEGSSGAPTGVGFIDKAGKVVIPAEYDGAEDFSEGFAAVQKNGKWGFIDKTGKEITPLQYSDTGNFCEGMAAVVKSGKIGYIDTTGKEVIPCAYDDCYGFFQGLAPVKKGGKYGFIDKTGELTIPCKFEAVSYFSDGLAMVVQNGKCGYIDTSGEIVIPCKYENAASFSEGFAAVYSAAGGSWGFIDKTGKEVVPPKKYTENGVEYSILQATLSAISFNDGYAYVQRYSSKESARFYFAITVDAKVSDWAREQVDSAAVKGLMADCLGDDFTVNITRAEFAAVAVELYEAMSGDTAPAPGENPFNDTTDPVIIQANGLGIVNGKGDGVFAPADPVTRQEAALMLSRVYTKLGGEIPKVASTTFADNDKVSSWAMDAVAFMSGKGIVNGVGGNQFDPQGNASIEQALIIALRMIENLDVE